MLIVQPGESIERANFKMGFQEMSIIFLKYFGVNWVFNGKISYKQIHLESIPKMLRRVKYPEYFTTITSDKSR